MTHRRLHALVLAAAASLTVACGAPSEPVGPRPAQSTHADSQRIHRTSADPQSAAPPAVPSSSEPSTRPVPTDLPRQRQVVDPIKARVQRMTLRDKAGQLLVLGFSGTTAPTQVIKSLHPGGLIYFSPNVRTTSQIATLSRQSQQSARASGQPLLLMTDQEGGPVTRLPGTSDVPAGTEFAGDVLAARRTASSTARELVGVGINVDLAPVTDVNTVGSSGVIGARSFSADPAAVSRMVAAQICGYHDGGVAAASKHWPGHGSTSTDSHLQTATITESRDQWRRTDLPPFARAVATGVDLIMVGHLAFPAVDPSGRPATISALVTRRLVRHDLGYDGVVITDALNMGGITSWGSSRTIAIRAILSGVDVLLMPPQPRQAVLGIVSAVRDGRIAADRLDASVERVLRLKQRLGLYRSPSNLTHCR